MPTKLAEQATPYFCLTLDEARALYELLEHEHVPYANEVAVNVIRKLSHFVRGIQDAKSMEQKGTEHSN